MWRIHKRLLHLETHQMSFLKDSFIIIIMLCFSVKTMIFYHHLILMILQLKALKLWNQQILLLGGGLGEVYYIWLNSLLNLHLLV